MKRKVTTEEKRARLLSILHGDALPRIYAKMERYRGGGYFIVTSQPLTDAELSEYAARRKREYMQMLLHNAETDQYPEHYEGLTEAERRRFSRTEADEITAAIEQIYSDRDLWQRTAFWQRKHQESQKD